MEGIDKRELIREEQSEFLLDQKCFETWVSGKVGLYSGIEVEFYSNDDKNTIVCYVCKASPSEDKRFVFSEPGVPICKKCKVYVDETTENIVEFLCEKGDSSLSDIIQGTGYYNTEVQNAFKGNSHLFEHDPETQKYSLSMEAVEWP